MSDRLKQVIIRGVGWLLVVAGMWLIPHRVCMREASRWYAGEPELQGRLASGVEEWIDGSMSSSDFNTGSDLFDGEWLFGTYMMAGLGYGQMALEHPETRDDSLKVMERCIDGMLLKSTRDFDTLSWGDDALSSLSSVRAHHGAYLGYMNIVLSMHRLLDTESRFAKLNDEITESLCRRIRASPTLLLATYPTQVFPVDNCAVVGSIGLYDRATGDDHRELLSQWVDRCKSRYVDRETGLLIQRVSLSGKPYDQPRGSGTALGLYFISFADIDFSRELYSSLKSELATTCLGFGGVREYPRGRNAGMGDIDSGPIVFGFGFSATGFALAGARLHGDRDYHRRLVASAHLVGDPHDRASGRVYLSGGPVGNALLFALLTARPIDEGMTLPVEPTSREVF